MAAFVRSGPPAGVEPETLLAEQVEQHPELAIDYRLAFAPQVSLSVRAVVGWKFARLLRARDRAGLVAEALLADGQRAMTARELGLMTPDEFGELHLAVWNGLLRICPTRAVSDVDAWCRALESGAHRNASIVDGMASCRDMVIGFGGHGFTPRPDRYWGRPVSELYDGQLMAFDAVMTLLSKHA